MTPQNQILKKKLIPPYILLLTLTSGVEQKKFREDIPTNKEVIGKTICSPSARHDVYSVQYSIRKQHFARIVSST